MESYTPASLSGTGSSTKKPEFLGKNRVRVIDNCMSREFTTTTVPHLPGEIQWF
jgi:hypothetical protein